MRFTLSESTNQRRFLYKLKKKEEETKENDKEVK